MKKVIKITIIGIVLLVFTLFILIKVTDAPLPLPDQEGAQADTLARKMEMAVNKAAWDSTRYVRWQFRTGTDYLWDKHAERVAVVWDEYKVILHTDTQQGDVYAAGKKVTDDATRSQLLQKAWAQFANDSFWLCAPMKAFDPGTKRSIVNLPDGSQGLLVTYQSGGVTPGDSYLWHLDEAHLPKAWQMWVNIIPVGGLMFTWEDWTNGEKGQPRIAQAHESRWFGVPIQGLSFPVFSPSARPLEDM